MTCELEEWVAIDGHEGYEVSTRGRVRTPRGRFIKREEVTGGYWRVTVQGKRHRVHRLVAWHFCNVEDLTRAEFDEMEVDHINRIRSDNRASNLRIVSKEENLELAREDMRRQRRRGYRRRQVLQLGRECCYRVESYFSVSNRLVLCCTREKGRHRTFDVYVETDPRRIIPRQGMTCSRCP